ncbi:MAG TPA: YgcG family protein [Methylophilaceae bacterium]|nr:YgcG family protein [Methylophilaceae bacterium]
MAADTDGLVAIPPLQARVTDLTGTLTPDQQAALENKLAAFEAQKGSQIAVLIVPTTQPEAIEQYSIRVVDQWQLGRKGVDDGVLVLLAKDDRKARIEVGYGLEGVLPDVIAKRIIENVMIPQFRQGDYYAGLDAGIDSIMSVIQGEPLPAPQQRQANGHNSWEGMLPLLLFGGLIAGGILRAVFGSFLGGAATGGLIGAAVWLLGGGLLVAIVLAIVAFFLTMSGGLGFLPIGGGGFGRGGGGFGGFSGGGGGFGGGGASGDW